ncbi:MAG: alpha/beta hydrolase [Flavobacteriaceae bacterium]|nr:alpha/beta hydrolase [Flavobacteriaceae bacterium]
MENNILFRTNQGRKETLEIYDQKLKELDINYEYIVVETSLGKTNIIKTGDPSKPALILIHGSNGCAPISLGIYPRLAEKYQVFAIDVLGQPNKSDQNVLDMKNLDYGKWIHEIIKHQGLKNVRLVGFSLGGLIALKTILFSHLNIEKAFLIAPAFIVNGNPLSALFKIFIPMKMYIRTQKQKYIDCLFDSIFTEKDEFAHKFLPKVLSHFILDFSPVPIIKESQARNIKTPIVIVAAGRDVIFPGNKMIKRSKKIFSSLEEVVLLENSKHVQSRRDNKLIEELILSK